jgi:phage terminase small subunit
MATSANDPVLVNGELIKRNIANGFEDLTLNERAFGLNYLVHYDERRAASECGYSKQHGARLLRKPLVAAFIKWLQDEQQIANIVTEEMVRTSLLNLIPRLSGEEDIPIVTKDGFTVMARKFHGTELISVLKVLREMADDYKGVKIDLSLDETFASIVDNHRKQTDAGSE